MTLETARNVLEQWMTVNGDNHWQRLREAMQTVLDAAAPPSTSSALATELNDMVHQNIIVQLRAAEAEIAELRKRIARGAQTISDRQAAWQNERERAEVAEASCASLTATLHELRAQQVADFERAEAAERDLARLTDALQRLIESWHHDSPDSTWEQDQTDCADELAALVSKERGDERVSSQRCPACPVEVRGLYAVAFNLLNLRSDPDRWQRKIGERLGELENAVAKMTPIVEAHFADREHAGLSTSAGLAKDLNNMVHQNIVTQLREVRAQQKDDYARADAAEAACILLRGRLSNLRAELLKQWVSNHAEHCTNVLNPDGTCPALTDPVGCQWPLPGIVADASLNEIARSLGSEPDEM